jgi:hypothetical protein
MGEPQEEKPTTGFLGRIFKGANNTTPPSGFDLSSFDSATAQQIHLAAYEGRSHPDPRIRASHARRYTELTGQTLPEIAPLETTPVHVPKETHVTAEVKAGVLARGRSRPPALRSTATRHESSIILPEGK